MLNFQRIPITLVDVQIYIFPIIIWIKIKSIFFFVKNNLIEGCVPSWGGGVVEGGVADREGGELSREAGAPYVRESENKISIEVIF